MNSDFTITIVGVGLIGGSIALDLKQRLRHVTVLGVDKNEVHISEALDRQIIDRAVPLDQGVGDADLVVMAVPVDVMIPLAQRVLDMIDNQVVMDVGSTKFPLLQSLASHPKRGRFVATHPMAGTEYSGPQAALNNLFDGKQVLLVDPWDSDSDALDLVEHVYNVLGMSISHIDSWSHDLHAAYVSHISHITSFALAITVLEKEKDQQEILNMAGGGFESTVRLANSAASMWIPIFLQNKQNLLDVIDAYITKMQLFREAIAGNDRQALRDLITEANRIHTILHKHKENPHEQIKK